MNVCGDDRPPPTPQDPRYAATGVGEREVQNGARAGQLSDPIQGLAGIGEMLDHILEYHRVEGSGL
jgi:hypothetical protein